MKLKTISWDKIIVAYNEELVGKKFVYVTKYGGYTFGEIAIHNDDHNSFDWVIKCLMKVCKHEYEQATQCAHIVHNNGKCDVKYGDLETISEMKNLLKSAGLSVTMEVNE